MTFDEEPKVAESQAMEFAQALTGLGIVEGMGSTRAHLDYRAARRHKVSVLELFQAEDNHMGIDNSY